MRLLTHRKRLQTAVALILVTALATAACTGGSDSADTTAAAALSGESFADEDSAAGGAEEQPAERDRADSDTLEASGVLVSQQPQDLGRDIIFTAQITVAVNDVASAGAEATRIIESVGGFLFGQQTTGEPEPMSVLVFKVQPADFQAAVERLGTIGELRNQTISADDVTERVVDLESRISTAEASVQRLRDLIQDAVDLTTIAQLENQLLERETTLETLRGQLRTIRDQVSLATITLTLTEALANPQIRLRGSAFPGHDDGISCPGTEGLRVDEGSDITLCYEIRNTGDTPLTGFELKDTVIGIELDDLIVVFGDPSGTLEPGQDIALALEQKLERNLRTQARVTAIPVNPEGQQLESRAVADSTTILIDAVDPGGLPGFRDGLTAGWDLLKNIGGLFVLVFGAVLPFIWLIAAAWLYLIWLRRRRARGGATDAQGPDPGADVHLGED